jgi:CubicO group peptidase (beta-lactamase class C family)
VHDENAFALGGAAGHTGLFGQMHALLGFAHDLLGGGAASGLGGTELAELHRRQAPTRGLGWEMPHPGWSGGDACSPDSIGHTGFTGTGLWIDFERDLAWSLLTNRVHPSRHGDSGIAALRRQVGEIVCTG